MPQLDWITFLSEACAAAIGAGCTGVLILVFWDQLSWFCNMLIRIGILIHMRVRGEKEWTAHRHSREYRTAMRAIDQRKQDPNSLTDELNAMIEAVLAAERKKEDAAK